MPWAGDRRCAPTAGSRPGEPTAGVHGRSGPFRVLPATEVAVTGRRSLLLSVVEKEADPPVRYADLAASGAWTG